VRFTIIFPRLLPSYRRCIFNCIQCVICNFAKYVRRVPVTARLRAFTNHTYNRLTAGCYHTALSGISFSKSNLNRSIRLFKMWFFVVPFNLSNSQHYSYPAQPNKPLKCKHLSAFKTIRFATISAIFTSRLHFKILHHPVWL